MNPARKFAEPDECIETMSLRFFKRILRAVRISKEPIHCPSCAHSFSMDEHLSRVRIRLQDSQVQVADAQKASEEAQILKLWRDS